MSGCPAVPPVVRFTVRALAGAADAVITKVAGSPWAHLVVHRLDREDGGVTWAGSSVGYDAVGGAAARVAGATEVVCAAGGPMIRPAESWAPSL